MAINTFLITRFNVPMGFKGKDGETIVIDDQWMEHRIELFEKYCLPSVANQTFKDFKWFILLSDHTDQKYIDRINQLENIVLVFGRNFHAAYDQLKTKYLSQEGTYITGRLDNDDSLHSKFLETVVNLATGALKSKDVIRTPFGVNFRSGLDHTIIDGNLFERDYPASSFVSVIDTNTADTHPKTVLDFHHVHISKEMNILNMHTCDPMWMINIHDKNVGNVVKGTPIEDKKISKSLFNIG